MHRKINHAISIENFDKQYMAKVIDRRKKKKANQVLSHQHLHDFLIRNSLYLRLFLEKNMVTMKLLSPSNIFLKQTIIIFINN